jgi:ferredoxin
LPDSEPGADAWLELNREMSEIWPNIGQKIDAMPNADAKQSEADKFKKFFSREPGAGN